MMKNKNMYLKFNLNLKKNDGAVQKWYMFKGSQGTFIIGFKQTDMNPKRVFEFQTSLL